MTSDKEAQIRSKVAVEHWNKRKKGKEPLGYLCHFCAERFGGVWPCGHIATTFEAPCEVCQVKRSLASPSDWSLGPDGKLRKITSWEWD